MGSHHAELGARGELQQQRALGNLLSVLCSTCGHTDFPFFSGCWSPCSVALSVKEARGTLLGKLWVLGCVGPELRPREPLRALPNSEPDPLHCPQPALRMLPCVFKVSPTPGHPSPGVLSVFPLSPGDRALLTRTQGRVCKPPCTEGEICSVNHPRWAGI